jgi:hypothetical protein
MIKFTYSDGKGSPVLCVWDRAVAKDAVRVTKPEDLPDVLPHGVKWSELKMLISPGMETRPIFRIPGQKDHFTKHDTFFYLTAFFDKKPKVLWLNVWKERVRRPSKAKS